MAAARREPRDGGLDRLRFLLCPDVGAAKKGDFGSKPLLEFNLKDALRIDGDNFPVGSRNIKRCHSTALETIDWQTLPNPAA